MAGNLIQALLLSPTMTPSMTRAGRFGGLPPRFPSHPYIQGPKYWGVGRCCDMECWEQASIKVIGFKTTFVPTLWGYTTPDRHRVFHPISSLGYQDVFWVEGKELLCFFPARLYCSKEAVKTSTRFLCLLTPWGPSWFLKWGECRGVSRGKATEGAYTWFASPHDGIVCRGHTYPSFAPNTLCLLLALQKW